MKKWVDTWHKKLAVIAVAAVIAFVGYRWIPWARLTPSDWGTWVGAIGTFGALLGTIHLARTETLQRERNELLLARLHAASMVMRLGHAETMTLSVAETLGMSAHTPTALAKNVLSQVLQKLLSIDLWQVSDLAPLVALPNNTAGKLAQIADHVASARKWTQGVIDNYAEMGDQDLIEFAEFFYESMNNTNRLLVEVVNTCRTEVNALNR